MGEEGLDTLFVGDGQLQAGGGTARVGRTLARRGAQQGRIQLGQDLPTADEMKPGAFAAFQKAEYAKWKPILDAAGVKVE